MQVRLSRSATSATAQSLVVTSPVAYQIFQRSPSNTVDIQIQGYYSGSATSIEAQWNGGAWTAIATVLGTGTWRGTLPAQSPGQGTLNVRAANATGTVISKSFVGVGDVFWVNGQSNAAGQFNSAQPYSHATLKAAKFRKDRTWEEYSDPSGAYIAGGSVWGRVATLVMAYTGAPVGFANCGIGSTALVNGAWNSTNGTAFDQSVYSFKQANSGGARAILWHQGETDTSNGVTQSAYNAAFDALIGAFQVGADTTAKTISAQIGQASTSTATNINSVRYAIAQAWDDNPNALWGPPLWDRNLADGLHWTTDADAIELAARWWRAIKYHCFDQTSEGRAPRYSSATYSGTNIDVLIQGGAGSLNLGASPTTGWAVSDTGGNKTISGVSLISGGLRVAVNSSLTGPVSLSLGSGNTGVGNTIKDSGAIAAYPIEPFAVTLP